MGRTLLAYVATLIAVVAAAAVRLSLDPVLEDRFPLLVFLVVVILAAIVFDGRGPAFVAIFAGALAADFFIMEPRHSLKLNPKYAVAMGLFAAAGVAMIQVIAALRSAKRTAEEKQDELQLEVETRLAAERVLAEREGLLRTTLASIGDAVITTDTDGQITSMNAVAEGLTGWTSAEALGRPLASVFAILREGSRESAEGPVERVLREGRIVGLANHTILIHRDGTERAIDDSASPIRNDDGVTLGVVLVFRDVTEQREVERKLREADLRKDEFLATLAHELRNPLAPIANSLELMKCANGDGVLIAQARLTIERQISQLIRLVDDLMDVSRITRNKVHLQRKHLDLASTIAQAVEICRPLCQARRHTLRLRLPETSIVVHADPVRLTQVFGNVLNNACKYTDQGGEIVLTAELREGQAVVHIRDSGIGIAAAMLPKVFDLFTQAEGSLARSDGGLGIGLSLVKRLVEMHGGTVTAHSAGLGHGSEFTITLPAVMDQLPDEPAREPRESEKAPAQRVLVVDDNEDGAESLAALLRYSGCDVVIANDGEQGLKDAETLRPDFIMLDIGLPGMNGFEVCRQIRSKPWGRGILIVALTGWGQDEDRRKSREAGFDYHLVKPLDFDVLLTMLRDSKRPRGMEMAESAPER